jgi:chorismate synthase
VQAKYERSDVCAVPAAAVVGEAVVAWELANAALEKFGGDAMVDVEEAVRAYAARIR